MNSLQISVDIRNIKSIFIVAIFLFFTTSSYSYDNFDECGLLLNEINKSFYALSLDEPSLEKGVSYYLKKQVGGIALEKFRKDPILANTDDLPYVRTKDNYVIAQSVASTLSDKNFKANAIIYSYDGIKTSKMNDKEIDDAYIKSGKFQTIDLEGMIFDYDEEGAGSKDVKMVWVHVKPNTISKIDTLTGTFNASYEFSLHWYNNKINTLADKVYQKAIKHDKKNIGFAFYCSYEKKQLGDLFIPDLALKNKSEEGESTTISYTLNYEPEFEDSISTTTFTKKIISSAVFQVDFNFKTFPFDKQFLKFEIENNDLSSLPISIAWDWYLPEIIQDFNSLHLMEWKKHDIGINYHTEENYIHETYHDVLEVIFVIERHFAYFIFKIILPVLLILILAWSTFWINARELESRLTVSVVCFLSLVAYTFVIDENLPKLSYLTVLDAIILLAYIFSAIPTFQSIYCFILLEKGGIKIANKFDNQFKKFLPIIFLVLVSLFFSSFVSGSKNTIDTLSFFK